MPRAIFFTSDTHFGHAGALTFYRRPFASVAAMDAGMVQRWNEVVQHEDQVWHLGDFAVGPSEGRIHDLLNQLHGQKHLVAGNNDSAATMASQGWSSVQTYVEMRIDGKPLVLCHYPFRTWHDMSKGALNLHGHSHGRLKPMPRQIDVGVDVWDFRPHTLEQMLMQSAG
jgi:calcineurin-like phosphoesterase family protein